MLEEYQDFLFRNRVSVDRDPLPKIDQVRRCVSADLEAAGTQQRLTSRDDTSFAVGAGDVDRGQLSVGCAEFFEEGFGPLETGFDVASRAGEERLDRFAVLRQEVVQPADAGLPLM